jgi:hypothetical protein
MFGAPDLRQVVARATELADGGRSHALLLRSDLVAEGQHATQQVAAAAVELLNRNRRGNDRLRKKMLGALQRALGVATRRDLATEGHLLSDKISTAIEELAADSRRHNDELRETVQGAVQQMGAVGGVAHAVEELAADSRRHNDELRETVQGAVSRELNLLGLVAEALEELASRTSTSHA